MLGLVFSLTEILEAVQSSLGLLQCVRRTRVLQEIGHSFGPSLQDCLFPSLAVVKESGAESC